MAEWYYSSDRKQLGPVSFEKLRRLAASDMLRPGDLVWQDGMLDWVEASSVPNLFPAVEERPLGRRAQIEDEEEIEADDAYERPRRRGRRVEEDYDDEELHSRRRSRSSANPVLWVVAIVGGLALIGVLVLVVVLLAREDGTRSFSLRDGAKTSWNIHFKEGHRVDIAVTSTGNSDVDLYVFDAQNNQVAFDDGDSKDCFVSFAARASQTFKVEVRNMHRIDQPGRNGPNSGTLKFTQTPLDGKVAQVPPPQQVKPPPPQVKPPIQPDPRPPIQQPPMKGGGKLSIAVTLGPGPVKRVDRLQNSDPFDRPGRRCKVYGYQMTAGMVYTIDMRSAEIDSYLRLEDPSGRQVAVDDDGGEGLNARITYRATETGLYRIIATTWQPTPLAKQRGNFELEISP